MRYLTVCLLLALAGPATARDYRAEARAAIALSLALQATPGTATPVATPCLCSPDCSCSCQQGGVCRCGPPVVGAPVSSDVPVFRNSGISPVPYFSRPAYYAPAPSFRQSFAPAFRGSGGACRSG
jgi:hypothetical protein